ncbi:energy transducer TonB [Pedobacter nototheniae]|uniref:energy transducer TonB n=1 Tax=Pedobacter nototheniae TaxID=2488994 RepID=UPI0010397DB9|nr:energy transducer TonB [Pedobacter nototheniae]
MKKQILLIALLYCVGNFAFAQQDTTTIYQSPKGYFLDPIRSKWIMKKDKEDNLWVVRLSNKKGVLQEKVSFADEELSIRKGAYERYEKGVLLEEGNYEMGYKTGTWSRFYISKQLKERVGYKWDKADGPIISYWDNKQIKTEGEFKLGKKVGHWKMFFKDGKINLDETYNGNGELLNASYFDNDGGRLPFPFIMVAPNQRGEIPSLYQTISRETRYPPEAQKNNTQGKVLIGFTIIPTGGIEDIRVIASPSDELSTEAIRVLKLVRNWNLGEESGNPVKTRYTISVNFWLN